VVESDSSECERILNLFPVSENAADKATLRVGKPFVRMLHVVDPLSYNRDECVAAAKKAKKIKIPAPNIQPKNLFVRCRPSGCIESGMLFFLSPSFSLSLFFFSLSLSLFLSFSFFLFLNFTLPNFTLSTILFILFHTISY
jgi:hypothetical protein